MELYCQQTQYTLQMCPRTRVAGNICHSLGLDKETVSQNNGKNGFRDTPWRNKAEVEFFFFFSGKHIFSPKSI